MANEWTLKGKAASDDTHKAIYHGTVAKEIWYKGKKIWDNAPDFWSFARPSRIGIAEWGDNPWRYPGLWALYRSTHAEEYVGVSEYKPNTAYLGAPFVHNELGLEAKYQEWADNPGSDYAHIFYSPYVTDGSSWFSAIGEYNSGELSIQTTRIENVDKRLVLDDIYEPGSYFNAKTYQENYPFDTARFIWSELPPGKYTIVLTGMVSAMYRTRQFVFDNAGNRRFWSITESYTDSQNRNVIDDVLSSSYLGWGSSESRYAFDAEEPLTLSVDSEIGGGTGSAGGTFSSSISVLARRSPYYQSGLRPGQLRGIFSTEPRGKGTRYGYVVNDMRGLFAGHSGYYNIDPTECIDPQTGVMTPITLYSGCYVTPYPAIYEYKEFGKRIASYGMYVSDGEIEVDFYEKCVLIRKGSYSMKLYYYKGSEDFGHNWSFGG